MMILKAALSVTELFCNFAQYYQGYNKYNYEEKNIDFSSNIKYGNGWQHDCNNQKLTL